MKKENREEISLRRLAKPQSKERLIRKHRTKKEFFPSKLQHLKQQINRLKNILNQEKHKMKLQHQSERKTRTRQLITAGGLLQKSGLLEAFHIESR